MAAPDSFVVLQIIRDEVDTLLSFAEVMALHNTCTAMRHSSMSTPTSSALLRIQRCFGYCAIPVNVCHMLRRARPLTEEKALEIDNLHDTFIAHRTEPYDYDYDAELQNVLYHSGLGENTLWDGIMDEAESYIISAPDHQTISDWCACIDAGVREVQAQMRAGLLP